MYIHRHARTLEALRPGSEWLTIIRFFFRLFLLLGPAVLSCLRKFFFSLSIFIRHSLPRCEHILEMEGNEQFDKKAKPQINRNTNGVCNRWMWIYFFISNFWCVHWSSNDLLCIHRTMKLIELVYLSICILYIHI